MRKSKLQQATEKRDRLKAEFEAKILERRLNKLEKLNSLQMKYDAVTNSKRRKSPSIETKNEEDVLRNYDRLKAIAFDRDLERNFSGAKGIVKQFKINVVGDKGKLQLNTADREINKQVETWFNSKWAKKCDARDNLHFSDFCQLVIASVIREGDCLVVFDDFISNSGQLIFFEADQLVNIDETDWKNQTTWVEKTVIKDVRGRKKQITIPLQQKDGVIYNKRGKVIAYAVSSKRGVTSIRLEEATIFSTRSAKLLKRNWRFNQLRGIPELITAASDLEDIYEMRAKELQSAKVASSLAGYTKSVDALEDNLLRNGIDVDTVLDEDTKDISEKTTYEKFESLTGGNWEYLDPDDDIKILDFNRPNIQVKDFFDFVHSSAGGGFGLAKSYTQLSADRSYTAFRGDMLLSWATFYDWQKWLERHFCDWVAKKAIRWAVDNKILNALPEDWEYQISWIFPKMPQVDPQKENNAKRDALKNGLATFSEYLGADWEEKFEKLAEQIKKAKELELPLSMFETKAGAPLT